MMSISPNEPADELTRWRSEHGHWLKDIKNWEKEHELIRESIDSLTQELRYFELVLEHHKNQISDHQECMAIQDGLDQHPRTSKNNGDTEICDLHQLTYEEHQIEEKVHHKLQVLQQDVLQSAEKLIQKLNSLL